MPWRCIGVSKLGKVKVRILDAEIAITTKEPSG